MIRSALNRMGKSRGDGRSLEPIATTAWEGKPAVDAFGTAIAASDWTAARAVYDQMPTWASKGKCLTSVELDDVIFNALGGWIAQSGGQDPLPFLIRGARGVRWAWQARGSGWSDTVTQEGWKLFFERLRTADQDLHRAGRLDPRNPLPWAELLPVAMGLQIPQAERDLRFEQVFLRDPTNLMAHLSYVQCVAEKWSGDDDRMWQFALDVHAGVPAGSPLRAVVASAYEELVFSNQRAENEPPHDLPAAERVVIEAVKQSVMQPEFGRHDWLDQRHALTLFLLTLMKISGDEAAHLGAQLVPMLRNSPNSGELRYMDGESDAHKWAAICHHFGQHPSSLVAA